MVSKAVHPNDDMLGKAAGGMLEYERIGEDAIKIIRECVPVDADVRSLLDFGCGHGRVARWLAAEYPQARRVFSDIDEEAWRFCATEFGHDGFTSVADFSQLTIPDHYDLIWAGSVFTHLDWRRCELLADKLISALAPGGVLVATFRGKGCLDRMLAKPEQFNMNGYYDQLFEDYERTGFGYMDYRGFENWGQNLFRHDRIAEIVRRADIVEHNVAPRYWAGVQTVAVWRRDVG